jgi:8-oxo-dGTP pyrophosphatase MutT (NUDIX family)
MPKLDPETVRRHKGVSFVGVGTVFFCHDGKGKFLMSKRSRNARDEQGKWEIAGGGLKWGVSAEDNLIREVKEEFGADAKGIMFLGYRDVFRKLDDGTPTHWLVLDYAVKVDPSKVRRNEPDLCDEIGWFTLDAQPAHVHSQHATFMNKYCDQLTEILGSKPASST